MEIKKNKSNSQKYVNIPSSSSLQEGDNVQITKVKELDLNDLKNFFETNKDKLNKLQKELKLHYEMKHLTPSKLFIDHYLEKNNISIKEGDYETEITFKRDETSIDCSFFNDEIIVIDSKNYIEVNKFSCFERVLAEDEYGYTFDKNKFTETEFSNSALIDFAINLFNINFYMDKKDENFLFSEIRFNFCSSECDENEKGYLNNTENIYLILAYCGCDDFCLTLRTYKEGKRIEFKIPNEIETVSDKEVEELNKLSKDERVPPEEIRAMLR